MIAVGRYGPGRAVLLCPRSGGLAWGEVLALADRILLTLVMLVPYGIGYALIRWTVGLLLPGRPLPEGLPLLLLGVPILLCLLFEGATGLWQHTPGSVGLGPLSVVMPMLLAGAGVAAIFLLLRGFGPVLPAGFTREQLGPVITLWGAATLAAAAMSLALWRFWPAPAPRLF